ncbi:MAG TPA: glycosyltransferase family 4 protein [Ktedonobacterales bacterium]
MSSLLDIALLTMGDPNRITGGYLFHQRMAERAMAFGASLRFVSLPGWPFPLAALAAVLTLRQAGGADALVLDSLAAAYIAPWLTFRPPHMPLVAMLHQPPGGIESGPLRRAVQTPFDWLAYARVAKLMVASEALAEQITKAGVPRSKLRVVVPGCDGASLPVVPISDLRQGRTIACLCVANWLPRKGILDLLEAFARLPIEAATLHLVGDPDIDRRYAMRVRARIAQPDLVGRVVIHGHVDPQTVPSFYAAADIFVLPSLVEPYGTVYGEAMAAGLPVVGYRAGNLPHLAGNGHEGLLVEPGDIAGLAHALRRLTNDTALREQFAIAAGARARHYPTWDDSARVFFKTIREVVDEA